MTVSFERVNHPLTKLEISAMRKCDRVAFRLVGGKSQIEAIAKQSTDAPFGGCVIIPTDTHFINYEENEREVKDWIAFEMISFSNTDPYWLTIHSFMKQGDEIELIWLRGAFRSPVTENAMVHGDQLNISIKRGRATRSFRLESRISLDNSARMIRIGKNF